MSLNSMIKGNSKQALRGNWGTAILVHLVPLGLSLISMLILTMFGFGADLFTSITYGSVAVGNAVFDVNAAANMILTPMFAISMLVLFLFSIFLTIPVTLGIQYWHLRLTKGYKESASGVFHFFQSGARFKRALIYAVQYTFRQMGWSLLMLGLPYALFILLIVFFNPTNRTGEAMFMMFSLLFVLLFLALAVLYVAYMNKYFLVSYKLVEDDETPVSELFRQSIEETKGYRFSLIGFQLTFIGWQILAAIFPPVELYVGPYYRTSLAMYARYIVETNRRESGQPPSPTGQGQPHASYSDTQSTPPSPWL